MHTVRSFGWLAERGEACVSWLRASAKWSANMTTSWEHQNRRLKDRRKTVSDGWQSGRMRRSWKPLWGQLHRGFESLTIRQKNINTRLGVLFFCCDGRMRTTIKATKLRGVRQWVSKNKQRAVWALTNAPQAFYCRGNPSPSARKNTNTRLGVLFFCCDG